MDKLGYKGDSKSFTELEELLTMTSALGEGFLRPIQNIVFSSYYVDREGAEEMCKELVRKFEETFTKKVNIFSSDFIGKIVSLLLKGIEEQKEIYPIKK